MLVFIYVYSQVNIYSMDLTGITQSELSLSQFETAVKGFETGSID